jgi:hypothetical protein
MRLRYLTLPALSAEKVATLHGFSSSSSSSSSASSSPPPPPPPTSSSSSSSKKKTTPRCRITQDQQNKII